MRFTILYLCMILPVTKCTSQKKFLASLQVFTFVFENNVIELQIINVSKRGQLIVCKYLQTFYLGLLRDKMTKMLCEAWCWLCF